ncbi:MAG TPA: SAM-dependent methyltransferase [Ignavibacteria bacterium]|nr:SAM-dependent methyltransferase [Ignavibacteria bacterium]
MRIDKGAPSNYSVSGIKKRIEKMDSIKHIPFGTNLDLGTGIGAYFSILKKHSKILYALDKDISHLIKFQKNIPDDSNTLFVSNAESLSIKNEKFDVIFAIEVIEHVENLKATVQEIYRILKPNGLLYVSVPNKYFPLETHMLRFGKYSIKGKYLPFLSMSNFIHNKIGTAKRFSKKDIISEFSKYNFGIAGIEFMMPPFDYFNFGRKYLKRLTDKLERNYFKYFSMTLIAVMQKR